MKPQAPSVYDESETFVTYAEGAEQTPEDDLWLSRLVPDFN
jgi:hypothetical protein